jgi:oligopeptide transport system permease protein
MSDASFSRPEEGPLQAPRGRSIWAEAWARLMANRAAVASLGFLSLMSLACLLGPLVSPHPYDRVYPDYVKIPPSLQAHPQDSEIDGPAEKAAGRMRAKIASMRIEPNGVRIELEGTRVIDEHLLVYFERSDLFQAARVVERADDGKRLVVEVPLKRLTFPFGTDANGRDLLTRTLIAGRVSLAIGLLASCVALVIGVVWGAVAGYGGGRLDMVMMRIVDILYALPFLFFVILLVVFFGRNFVLIFVAVGAVEWLDMARIVRGQTLTIKRHEYVQAAEALGLSTTAILRRHVIPNTIGPVVVYLTLLVPRVILLESFLSFFGLGVQEPMTSWGVLVAEGARNIQGASGMLILPALFLTSTLFALNFVGDGLRDALDPKDR